EFFHAKPTPTATPAEIPAVQEARTNARFAKIPAKSPIDAPRTKPEKRRPRITPRIVPDRPASRTDERQAAVTVRPFAPKNCMTVAPSPDESVSAVLRNVGKSENRKTVTSKSSLPTPPAAAPRRSIE